MTEKEEMPFVQKIWDDEKWLASERHGFDVGAYHPEVLERLTQIILDEGEGAKLRKSTCEEYKKGGTNQS